MVYNRSTGDVASLTETLDRGVSSISWSPESTRLFFTAEDRGREPIFTVPVEGGGTRVAVFGDAHHGDVQLTPDGKSVVYSGHSGSNPVEIFRGFSSGGPPERLTHLNDAVLAEYESTPLEEVTYESSDGSSIGGFLVKPAGFDFERKYPLLLLVHGGPQGAWGESWSYRWNPQVFAGAGFVVFMPNPRGSTGYGQALTDGDQRRLGRHGLRRHHGGRRLRAAQALHQPRPARRRRSFLWRLHDQLDAGPHRTAFRRSFHTPGFTTCGACSARPRSFGFRCGSFAGPPGKKPKCMKSGRPACL